MNCISGEEAEFLCLSKNCQQNNSFVCSFPNDECKRNHECCSLVSLSYVIKISQGFEKQNSKMKFENLEPIYQKIKKLTFTISQAYNLFNLYKQLNILLKQKTLINSKDKDKISKLINDGQTNLKEEQIYQNIEKELEQFQVLINEFQINMRKVKNEQISQLKKKLSNEDKIKNSEIKEYENKKRNNKIKDKESPIKNMDMKISGLSDNYQNVESKISPSRSKIVQKQEKPLKQIRSKRKSSEYQSAHKDSQQKMSSIIKNHVPIGPLFSKITNEIKLIESFFYEKIKLTQLLYRASQNQFLVSKFHRNCDGHKNTLTIILTQFNKIIGGFTTIPWSQEGGQWKSDKSCKSFIFSITDEQKYSLIYEQKAIWCSKTYGPSFGHPDLEISDKSYSNSNSCVNFPNCYTNGKAKNNQNFNQKFCGAQNGNFKIKQWEVFQLIFQ